MKVRQTANGLIGYDLTGSAFGLGVRGRGKPGAELVWLRTAQGDTTYFSGTIEGRDLAETFRELKMAPALTSDEARLEVDLQWPGAPPQASMERLLGVVQLQLERGVFSRGGSVGENPLVKLIGLLNFDTLARRLRLDFSDLGTAGLGYENIRGTLLFDGGVIRIPEPLQVETPSSHLQLAGDLDVLNETLDAQLVATLPLAGNLTVAAALTGAVPLAVGVYVAGKVFKSQVDRASSLRYHITGEWERPEARLEKIFANRVDPAEPAPDSGARPAAPEAQSNDSAPAPAPGLPEASSPPAAGDDPSTGAAAPGATAPGDKNAP